MEGITDKAPTTDFVPTEAGRRAKAHNSYSPYQTFPPAPDSPCTLGQTLPPASDCPCNLGHTPPSRTANSHAPWGRTACRPPQNRIILGRKSFALSPLLGGGFPKEGGDACSTTNSFGIGGGCGTGGEVSQMSRNNKMWIEVLRLTYI